jgi:uncharacterized protein YndB with AHSA1/START domain
MNLRRPLKLKVERTIPAPLDEVFDAWLNPKIPGNPWNAAEKFMLDPKVDGLFYWTLKGTSHYGRFTEIERPGRIQHTWVSPNTLGEESTVTVTFKKQEDDTLMTLVHSALPDTGTTFWKFFVSNLEMAHARNTAGMTLIRP